MNLDLSGANALVTGASRGIGRAVAERLAAEGCNVAVNARGAGPLCEFADQLQASTGVSIAACPGDMSDAAEVRKVVARAIERLGHLDILVTCAGSVPGGLVVDVSDDAWHAGLDLKFLGYVRCCREVLPQMESRRSGSIVLVVGNAGLKPSPWELAAGAANAANLNFASALADQYASLGIRVNTVNPGPVETSRWPGSVEGLAEDRGLSLSRAREVLMGSLPTGQLCQADDVAPLVAFLASPRARYVTGAHIVVDGAQRKDYLNL